MCTGLCPYSAVHEMWEMGHGPWHPSFTTCNQLEELLPNAYAAQHRADMLSSIPVRPGQRQPPLPGRL